MPKVKIKCDWCGQEYKKEVRRINEAQKNNWRNFCSPACLKSARQNGKYFICNNPLCNKKFYRRRAEINKTSRSFCSISCSAIINNLERDLENAKRGSVGDDRIELSPRAPHARILPLN